MLRRKIEDLVQIEVQSHQNPDFLVNQYIQILDLGYC